MKKNIFKIGSILILLLVSWGFYSCDEDSLYSDEYFVFVRDNGEEVNRFSKEMLHYTSERTLLHEWPIRASREALADIEVNCEIDPSLVAAYNEEHESEYAVAPTEALVLENAKVIIRAGQMISDDSLKLYATDAKLFPSGHDYLIPIRIRQVVGEDEGVQISNNLAILYMIVKIKDFAVSVGQDTMIREDVVVNSEAAERLTVEFAAYSSSEPVKDIKVTFAADHSLVDIYNAANETSYKTLSTEYFSLKNSGVITLKEGETVSSEKLGVEFKNLRPLAARNETYLLPVRITSVEDSENGVEVARQKNVMYLVIKPRLFSVYADVSPAPDNVLEKTVRTTLDVTNPVLLDLFKLRAWATTTGNISGTFGIDNSLVAAYNEEQGRKYLTVPDGACELENSGSLSIANGAAVSVKNLRLVIHPDRFTDFGTYLIPVKLTNVTADQTDEARIDEERNIVYVILSLPIQNVSYVEELAGTLLDKSAWSAVANNDFSDDYKSANAIDGDPATGWGGSWYSRTEEPYITVNLGESIEDILGFKLTSIGEVGSGYWTESWNPEEIEILVSTNGELWESQGLVSLTQDPEGHVDQYVKFDTPVMASQVRILIKTLHYKWADAAGFAEINVIK